MLHNMLAYGIENIGYALGSHCIDNIQAAASYSKSEDFIRDKIGFLTLRRMGQEQSLQSLCKDAFNDLTKKHSFRPESCELLIVVTQNPDGGHALPHISALLQNELGLSTNIAAFDIGLGCSGYVYALSIACAFMQLNNINNGLLFTADPYSSILNYNDANTQLLFGDAATCTLLSNSPKYKLGKSCFGTDGSRADSLCLLSNGILDMKGRDIFNFSLSTIPDIIKQCVENNKLDKEDIDCLLLHHASKFIVDTIGQRLSLPNATVPFLLQDIGNCVSSTIPIALSRLDSNFKSILISGFGVGLSWGASVLFHTEL